jgi:hypothetical protein
VHSDLKEFPIESYSKFKYLVSFLDDYSSNAWVVLLCKKSETLTAFRHFVAMVKTQFKVTIGVLMSALEESINQENLIISLKAMEYNLVLAYLICTNKMDVQNTLTGH